MLEISQIEKLQFFLLIFIIFLRHVLLFLSFIAVYGLDVMTMSHIQFIHYVGKRFIL